MSFLWFLQPHSKTIPLDTEWEVIDKERDEDSESVATIEKLEVHRPLEQQNEKKALHPVLARLREQELMAKKLKSQRGKGNGRQFGK